MILSDRQKRTIDELKGIDSGNEFFWDDKTGIAKFIKGRLSKPSNDEPEAIARAFLEDNSGLLDVQEDLNESLKVVDTYSGDIGKLTSWADSLCV